MKGQARIVLSDLHVPFHDERLLDVWVERLDKMHWDGIDIIGDFLDCYSLSRFDTNPDRKADFQTELDRGKTILETIRLVTGPATDIRYSEGNHEDRLRKHLWGKDRRLADLRNLTIPHLLGLDELGVKWYPTEKPYQIGDLWYSHGDILRSGAGATGRAKSTAMGGPVLIGHTHRLGFSPRTMHTGTHESYEVGYMADSSKLDYHRYVYDWQLGWAEVFFNHGTHWVNFFRVVDRGRERMVIGPEGKIAQWRTRR
jgi:hypothetical protein